MSSALQCSKQKQSTTRKYKLWECIHVICVIHLVMSHLFQRSRATGRTYYNTHTKVTKEHNFVFCCDSLWAVISSEVWRTLSDSYGLSCQNKLFFTPFESSNVESGNLIGQSLWETLKWIIFYRVLWLIQKGGGCYDGENVNLFRLEHHVPTFLGSPM